MEKVFNVIEIDIEHQHIFNNGKFLTHNIKRIRAVDKDMDDGITIFADEKGLEEIGIKYNDNLIDKTIKVKLTEQNRNNKETNNRSPILHINEIEKKERYSVFDIFTREKIQGNKHTKEDIFVSFEGEATDKDKILNIKLYCRLPQGYYDTLLENTEQKIFHFCIINNIN